jgi:Uma2 family endonuclease
MTAEQFLEWSELQPEGRFELVNGEVIMMAPERVRHVRTKGSVFIALLNAVRKSKLNCHVLGDGIGVKTGSHMVREPDASVQVGGELDPDSLVLDAPSILVEVLSPSNERSDTGEKLEEYFSLPTVQHYLIVNPERKSVIHHRRMDGGHIDTVVRHDGEINFEPFDFSVDVMALFGEVDQ